VRTRKAPPSAGGAGARQAEVSGAVSIAQGVPEYNLTSYLEAGAESSSAPAQADRWSAVPAELKKLNRWLVYRCERKGKRVAKVPCSPRTGRPVDHTNAKHWMDFKTACAHAHRFDGIGFALGDGIAGVDLDKCRDKQTGALAPAKEKMARDLRSYAEVSRSGTGVHVFIFGTLPPGRRNNKNGVELYDRGQFLTVTGHHLAGTPPTVEHRQAELAALHAQVFGPATPRKAPRPTCAPAPLTLTDEDLLAKARTASNGAKFTALFDRGDVSGYPTASEADAALCNYLAFWTRGDVERMDRLFRRSALMRGKWHRPAYREHTLAVGLTGANGWSDTPTTGRHVRLPRALLDLPAGAGMLAAVLVAFEVIGAGEVLNKDLAATLGVDGRTVRRWQAQLQVAGVPVAQAAANFVKLLVALVLDRELPFEVRWTALHVAACVRPQGFAEVSQRALADRTGKHPRTVRRHLCELEERGYLRRDRFRFDAARGRRAVNRYRLQTPPGALERTLVSCSPANQGRTLVSAESSRTRGGGEGEAVAVGRKQVSSEPKTAARAHLPAHARRATWGNAWARIGAPRRSPAARPLAPTTLTTGTLRRQV